MWLDVSFVHLSCSVYVLTYNQSVLFSFLLDLDFEQVSGGESQLYALFLFGYIFHYVLFHSHTCILLIGL